MRRLAAYISGKVQRTGYRARVVEIAKALKLKGLVINMNDGRVKIIAEGEDDRLRWFEDAIDIKNTLIHVSSIEKIYSPAVGEFDDFYKIVDEGETDSRLDTAAILLKDLIGAVNNMNNNLGGKIDAMNENLGSKMDLMLDKQDAVLDKQDDLIEEVRESRKDLKGYLDRRFEKVEGEVAEIKTALKSRGII